MEFSVLKPDAPYPPRPNEEADWQEFEYNGQPGAWNSTRSTQRCASIRAR
ncbi:MAG TPA: hypothetical protein VM141_13300 [Planctomycetota bacterium]|nr:hypothetical protein [Planctomycetota bacterium]